MPERIQKLIAASGLMSRRAAEQLILNGRVTVNGIRAELGDKADSEQDTVLVDGKPLQFPESHHYIMLNKPRGVVTSMHDEKGRTDISAIVRTPYRIYPVGRLDMDSEGLLLLTDDGELANSLMHPSHEIEKTYLLTASGADGKTAARLLAQPMELDGRALAPVYTEYVNNDENGFPVISVRIHEGRNRQIRRMCEQCGLKVRRLQRVSEGPLQLGTLRPGQWRLLTPEERNLINGKGRTGTS